MTSNRCVRFKNAFCRNAIVFVRVSQLYYTRQDFLVCSVCFDLCIIGLWACFQLYVQQMATSGKRYLTECTWFLSAGFSSVTRENHPRCHGQILTPKQKSVIEKKRKWKLLNLLTSHFLMYLPVL